MNSQFDGDDFKITLDQNVILDSERARQQKLTTGEPKSFSSDGNANMKSPLNNYGTYNNNSGVNNNQINVSSNDYNLSKATHPFACVATFIFKLLGILFYLLIGAFMPNVLTFIIVTVLSALDFWTVKNITGRLLVGLRWWSDYDQNGLEIWKFESRDQQGKNNGVDKAFFWTSQLGATIFWALMMVIKILTLSIFWGMLVLINLVTSMMNLYGYYKCRGDHSKKLKNLQSQGLRRIAGKLF